MSVGQQPNAVDVLGAGNDAAPGNNGSASDEFETADSDNSDSPPAAHDPPTPNPRGWVGAGFKRSSPDETPTHPHPADATMWSAIANLRTVWW